jgi:hypothetical protein
MILEKVKLSKLDNVDSNNFIVPKNVVEEFIENNPSYEKECGTEIGLKGLNPSTDEVSHVLRNLRIEDGFLYGDVEIYDNDEGNELKKLVDGIGEENLCGAFVATVDYDDESKKVVTDVSEVLCFYSEYGRNY